MNVTEMLNNFVTDVYASMHFIQIHPLHYLISFSKKRKSTSNLQWSRRGRNLIQFYVGQWSYWATRWACKSKQDPKAETLVKQRPAALIYRLRHMTSTYNNYSIRLTTFDAQKKWAWCNYWHEEKQMSWFSICCIKLVTCTWSQKAKEISLQFFPWCTALLTHFLGIGRIQNKGWHHTQWCSSWPNEQSTNQSAHKFSSEVMFWVIG